MTDRIWLDKADIAGVLGIGPRHFDASVRPQMPDDASRGKGATLEFDAAAAVAAWVAMKVSQAKSEAAAQPPDPLLAGGTDSPQLERYRAARADLAELERDRVKGGLVRLEDLEPKLMRLTGILRQAGDTLARRHGNEAAGVLNEAVDEFERGLNSLREDLR